MEVPKDQQAKVGLFVGIGIIVIALSLIFLGEDQSWFSRSLTVKVKFAHVQGLSRGSIVSLAGVRVGNVSHLDFSKDDDALIAFLRIERTYQHRLTEGATASVKTLGALGDKFIYIEPGPREAKPLEDGDFLISAGSDDFLDIVAKKGDQLAGIADVVTELHILLKNLNQDGRSGRLIQNLADSAGEMKMLASETRLMIRQAKGDQASENRFRDVLRRMDSILQKIDSGEGSLGALINDPTLHQKLVSLVGESPRKNYLKPLVRETIRHQDQSSPK